MKYRSEVLFLGFKVETSETFEFSNLDHAIQSNDMVLESIRPMFRPFCKVEWIPVNDALTSENQWLRTPLESKSERFISIADQAGSKHLS